MRYVSILRGINVGGKRRILMADLKTLYTKLGFINPQSYIQSGNVIFDFDGPNTSEQFAKMIEDAIKEEFSFDVPVIIRTIKEFEELFTANPYLKSKDFDSSKLHLTFLATIPEAEVVNTIDAKNYSPDDFKLIDKHIYIHCNGKYHETKLNNQFFEKKLKTKATTRNWKTVSKLYELAIQR